MPLSTCYYGTISNENWENNQTKLRYYIAPKRRKQVKAMVIAIYVGEYQFYKWYKIYLGSDCQIIEIVKLGI